MDLIRNLARQRGELAMKKRVSNYELMRDRMELEFLKYDQNEMIRKFNLKYDRDYIYIEFISKEYRISRTKGRVEWYSAKKQEYVHGNYNESMTIFDILCYSKPDCKPAGSFVGVNNLEGVLKTASVGADMFLQTAKEFADQCRALENACKELRGRPEGKADVSMRIPLFDFLPVILQFWDADEEFDPVLRFLWDKNTLHYMHYETTYFAASCLIERIKEKMFGHWR